MYIFGALQLIGLLLCVHYIYKFLNVHIFMVLRVAHKLTAQITALVCSWNEGNCIIGNE